MKKMLFLWLAICFAMSSLSAQTLINENFNGGTMPATFTLVNGACGWTVTQNGSSTYWSVPTGNGYYAIINDDGCGSNGNNSNVWMKLPALDFSSSTALTLTFNSCLHNVYGDIGLVKVSIDGGTTWTDHPVPSGNGTSWDPVTIDLTSYCGNASVIVAFYYSDGSDWLYGWAVDDIVIAAPSAYDLAALSLTPENLMVGYAQTPYLKLKNNGGTAVTTADYTIQLTDGGSYTQTINGVDLAIGQDTTITFPNYTASNSGSFSLTATITYAVDLDLTNNTITITGTAYDVPVYTHNAYTLYTTNGTYYGFDVQTSTLTSAGTGIPTSPFPMSETWVGTGTTGQGDGMIVRVCEDGSFGYVLANGVFVKIGKLLLPSGVQPVSLAYDRTNNVLYGLGVDGTNTAYLATIDLTSLAVSVIGSTGNTQLIIGIDFADDGFLYGPALVDDNLYKIDPADATTTLIGSTGLNLNYGQDVAFDYVSNKLYSYAYNITPSNNVKYGYYNLSTGAFTEIAPVTPTGQYASTTIITNTLPSCEIPSGLVLDSMNIALATAYVSWDAPAGGTPDNGYEFYVSTNNTTPSTEAAIDYDNVVVTEYAEIPLTIGVVNYVWVRSLCNTENSAWSLFNLAIQSAYCIPAPTSVDAQGITNVTFGDLIVVNNTTGAEAGNYGNYSNMTGVILEGTASFPVSVTQSYAGGYITKIWIDWNHDLVFDDVTELAGGPTGDVSGVQTITVTVPANTPIGSYRMRIGSHDGPSFGALVPCYVGSYGSYEDYTLQIASAPTCMPVTGLTVDDVTPYTATLLWNNSVSEPAAGYQVYYSTTAGQPTGTEPDIIDVADTTYVIGDITPLNPITTYYVYVRANCGNDDYSFWMSSSFTTGCAPITNLPYIQNFDSYATGYANPLPTCWTKNSTYATGYPYLSTSYRVSNPNSLYVYNYGSTYTAAFLPEMGISLDSLAIKFKALRTSSTANYTYIDIMVATDPNNSATWTQLGQIELTGTTSTWYSYSFSLGGYQGAATYIGLRNSHSGTFYIDDVEVTDCLTPTNISLSDLTSSTADLVWTDLAQITSWDLKVSSTQLTDMGNETGDIFDNTITDTAWQHITGLSPETLYYVYLRNSCDTTWVTWQFTTPAACPLPTGLTFTPTSTTTATITWNALGMTGWNIKVSTTAITDFDNVTGDVFDGPVYTTPEYLLTDMVLGTTYYYYVQSDCGGAWANSSFTPNYCAPHPTSVDGAGITNVTFGSSQIVNNTTTDEPNHYGNYSNLVGNGYVNDQISVNITLGTNYNYDIKIWVDWNNDLIFDPVTELVYTGQSSTGVAAQFTAGSDTGMYRMRIGSCDNYYDPTPCYTGYYGSYEDYTLHLLPLPDCSFVTGLSVTDITSTSATAYWNPTPVAPANGYQVLFATTNTMPDGTEPDIISVIDTFSNNTLLNPQTVYYVWVRSDCGGGEYSDWRQVSFSTPCVEITALPWSENFDALTSMQRPPCWSVFNGGTTFPSVYSTSTSYSSPNCIYYSSTTNAMLVTPAFGYELNDKVVSFKLRREGSSSGTFSIGYLTNIADGNTYVPVHENILATYSTWTNFDLSLAAFPAGTNNIVFKQNNASTAWYYWLDDVSVRVLSDENDIVTFTLPQQIAPATIDVDNHTVDIVVNYSTTNLTALVPTITVSPYATISPLSGVAQDFSVPVTYTVTSELGTPQTWTVNVTTSPTASSLKDIVTFTLPSQTAPATIDADAATVDININFMANLASLTPTITVSPFATISPLSGVAQDFTNPVTYTVTAEDGTTKVWTVTVTQETIPLGAACGNPIPYTINDPEISVAMNTVSRAVWFSVTLDNDYTNVSFTTCGTGFDTKLFVVNSDCSQLPTQASNGSSGDYMFYNDDALSATCTPDVNQSEISVANASAVYPSGYTGNFTAGTYYVVVTPYYSGTTVSTNATLLVTGTAVSTCAVPTNVNSSQITANGATITWTAGGDETEWLLSWKETSTGTWNTPVYVTPNATYNITGLTMGTSYNVRVRAICSSAAGDTSVWTAAHTFTTTITSCPTPTNVTATATGATTATITWTPGGNETQWLLEYGIAGAGYGAPIAVNSPSPYTLSGLQANTNYNVRMRALCVSTAIDTSDYSNIADFTTPQIPCDDPVNIDATNITEHTITLTWQPLNGENEWKIFYRQPGETAGQIGNITSPTYTLTDLVDSATYEICVVAVCAPGVESDPSNCINVTTLQSDIPNIQLANGVKLYPNPATNQVTVMMESSFNSIEITNTIGQVIYKANLSDRQVIIDITQYGAGMYYVKLQGDKGMVTKKFVKK